MVYQCVTEKPCAYICGYTDNQLSGEKTQNKPKQKTELITESVNLQNG